MKTGKKVSKEQKKVKKDRPAAASPKAERVSAKDRKKVMEQLRALGYI